MRVDFVKLLTWLSGLVLVLILEGGYRGSVSGFPWTISCLSTAKLGDNVLDSVRPSVCPFVIVCALLAWLNRLIFDRDTIFCMEVDLDLKVKRFSR